MKVVSIHEDNEYFTYGKHSYDFTFDKVNKLDGADLVVFWGGEDISPGIYGEKPQHTNAPSQPSKRDDDELKLFRFCVDMGIPMLGICRGAQFLCAASGGSLWQHVENHTRSHQMQTHDTDQIFTVTSTHHQMMRPPKDGLVLAEPVRPLSPYKYNDKGAFEDDLETEVLYIPRTKALCVQGHPEYTGYHNSFADYVQRSINHYLGVEL